MSILSYLNPLSYFSSWSSGYGRNAPSVAAIKSRIASPKFVNVSENQLKEIIKNLRPIPPPAPPLPVYLNLVPTNCREELSLYQGMTTQEILNRLKATRLSEVL